MTEKEKTIIEEMKKMTVEILKYDFESGGMTENFRREMISEAIYLISLMNSYNADKEDENEEMKDDE